MKAAFKALDRILRGEATRPSALEQGSFDIPANRLFWLVVGLSMVYGACMGLSAVAFRWDTPTRYMGFEQLGASMVKLPLLFVLTVIITFPSLYVFNALIGSRLSVGSMFRLLVATNSVLAALLSSFGPIVAFFAISTVASYSFIKVLHVAAFTVAGGMGLRFLFQTLHRLTVAQLALERARMGAVVPPLPAEPVEGVPPQPEQAPTPAQQAAWRQVQASALDRVSDQATPASVMSVFRIWVVLFAVVGAQMGWVLRPFIGSPDVPFTFFRPRDSNFFEAFYHTIQHLLQLW